MFAVITTLWHPCQTLGKCTPPAKSDGDKMSDKDFRRDIEPLLAMGTTWDFETAIEYVLTQIALLFVV